MAEKLKDLEDARAEREKELRDKESKMLNWEDRLKEEQAK